MVTDYVSDQLRAQAAALRRSVTPPAAPAVAIDYEALAKADRAARSVVAVQRQADAMAEWESLRAAVPDGKTGATPLAVLDVHKPFLCDIGFNPVPMCEHCQEGGYDGDSVKWECETYAVIREGLT